MSQITQNKGGQQTWEKQQKFEEDFRLVIRLPRQSKDYYKQKLGLITFPEDIEQLSICVESGKDGSELDEERSLEETSKYTQLLSECVSLRSFSFSVEYQQQFMDYSDLLFYSVESMKLQQLMIKVRGLSKSKDSLSKIFRSLRSLKHSLRVLEIELVDIFLNEDSFTALFLLIKNAEQLQQLAIHMEAKFLIQLEKVDLFCKILESATQLTSLSLIFGNIRFLRGVQYPLEQMNLRSLKLDFVEAQLFDNSFITQLIKHNLSLRSLHLRVDASNSLEDVFLAIFDLPDLFEFSFECTSYLQDPQYKLLKNFICKKSSFMYITIKLDQPIEILYDRSTRIFKNMPYLCAFNEVSDSKVKKRDQLKKTVEYFIARFVKFRRNYIYSLLAIKKMRQLHKKALPKQVFEDIINQFITFEHLEQLIDQQPSIKQTSS